MFTTFKYIKILGFICLCGLPQLNFAQYKSVKFGHLKPNDGLSQATIRAIYQDTFGFMWFGTQDGLNKYDGRDFTTYFHDDQDQFSIPGSRIYNLYEDNQQRLWITTTGGLCYLDRELDKFIRVYPDSNDSNAIFTEFSEDKEGHLWLSSNNGALYRKPHGENDFTVFSNQLSQEPINEFIILQNGHFWVASSDYALYEFNPEFRNVSNCFTKTGFRNFGAT